MAKSSLKINPTTQKLNLLIDGIEMLFDMDFDLSSEPHWFKDKGNLIARVHSTRLEMDLDTYSREGVLQIDFSKVKIDISNYVVEVNGATDLSRALEIIFNSFKTFFREELVNMLAWRAAKAAEDALNRVLFDQGEVLAIDKDRTMHINAKMVSDPLYHDGLLTVALDGTFASQNPPPKTTVKHQLLPLSTSDVAKSNA
jgi:hypothetical protein